MRRTVEDQQEIGRQQVLVPLDGIRKVRRSELLLGADMERALISDYDTLQGVEPDSPAARAGLSRVCLVSS